MSLAHNTLDLVVDALGCLGGVVLVVGVIATQEHLVLCLTKDLRTQLLAHAVARYHLASHLGCPLEIVARTGSNVVASKLFCRAPTKQGGNLVEHGVACLQEVIFLGQLERIAKRTSAANNRDLMHWVGVLEHMPHQGMATLVVGNNATFLLGNNATLALGTSNYALHSLFDLGLADGLVAAACGEQGRLVHEVGKISTSKAWG